MSEHISDKIKVVLFDHDDTLVGTIGSKWDQHKFIASKYYGKELTDEDIKLHWGKPLGEMICLLYGTDDMQEALDHNVAHHKEFEKQLFEFTVPVLEHIRASGKMQGIVTATTRQSFEHDLDHHNVPRELLDYTQTADDTSFHKPDRRVFEPALLWLASNAILPEETLYIGDGLHDMKAAIGAGFNFLGVETGLVTADEFLGEGATSISGIKELIT